MTWWYFRYLTIDFSWKGTWSFIWYKQVWKMFTKECFVPSLVEIGPVVLENIFKYLRCDFALSLVSNHCKSVWHITWTNLRFPTARSALYLMWSNWRGRFLNVVNISIFRYSSPLRNEQGPLLEQTLIPLWNALWQVGLKLVRQFWRIFLCHQCSYFTTSVLSPIGKGSDIN